MKTHLKIIFLGLIILISFHSSAQRPKQSLGKSNIDSIMPKLNKQLDLSEEQTVKIRKILLHQRDTMKTIMMNYRANNTPKEERRKGLKGVLQHTDSLINGVLSTEQQAKYQQYKIQMRDDLQKKLQNNKKRKNFKKTQKTIEIEDDEVY